MKRLPPNLELRGEVYRYRVKINGKLHRVNLNTRNFNEAMVKYREILANGHESFVDTERTPGAAPKRYALTREYADRKIQEQLDRGTSEKNSKCGLAHQWARLCTHFPTVDTITDDSVAHYFHARLRAGYSRASVARDIPLLRLCVNTWGIKQYRELDTVEWKVPRKRRGEVKGVNAGEAKDPAFIREWLAALPVLARAQATVALATALRATELRRLQPLWVKPIRGEPDFAMVHLPEHATKSGMARMIAVPQSVARLIRQHFPLATDFRKTYAAAARELGHDDTVTLRDLRHTFKTEIGEHEGLGVMQVMGHHHFEGGAADAYRHQTVGACVMVAKAVARLLLAEGRDHIRDHSTF